MTKIRKAWVSWEELNELLGVGGSLSVAIDAAVIGGLTSGSIIFASATGFLTEDNANLFWDVAKSNLGIGTNVFGATMEKGLQIAIGAAPTGNVADTFAFYAADVSGKACPHFRTEDSVVIKLNQSLLTTDSPTYVGLNLSGELDITGADACIDLNPAGTGTKKIIDITPSAALIAGRTWDGVYIDAAALDPAEGDPCTVHGFHFTALNFASAEHDAQVVGFITRAAPADDFTGFRATITELTENVAQNAFRAFGGNVVLSATGKYRGLYVDYDGLTRDGGAPILEGVRIKLPANYTGFGASFAGYFEGDGRSVTLCDTDYALVTSGDMNLVGSIIGVTSFTMVNAINEFSTDVTLGGDSDSAIPTEKAVKAYCDALPVVDTHVILDDAVHTDTLTDPVIRGALIHGNNLPLWAMLALGAADTFLGSDGTDVSYRTAAQVLASLSGEATATFSFNNQSLSHVADIAASIITISNMGLHILDSGGDHDLIIAPNQDYTADRTLTLTIGDANRTLTLDGNPTLNDWFDQGVKQADTPTFAGLIISTGLIDYDTTNHNYLFGVECGTDISVGDAKYNVFIGNRNGEQVTTGDYNVAIGYLNLYGNKTGDKNVAIGSQCLVGNTNLNHTQNVAIGYQAAYTMETGTGNVAIGIYAGKYFKTGSYNVALGGGAGTLLSSGDGNMFIGASAGYSSNAVNANVYIGVSSGFSSTGGNDNTGIGGGSLYFNVLGDENVAIGVEAMRGVSTKSQSNNVFIGYQAGYSIDVSNNNVVIGYKAGYHITTGYGNIVIGYMAGETNLTVGNNQLWIANSNTATPLIYGEFDNALVKIYDFLFLPNMKSGATQVAAGAAAGELWYTNGHATLLDNIVMIGA